MKKIMIVVPVYNEEEMILKYYEKTTNILNTIKNYDFKILFVDDGSKDKTLDVIKSLSKKDNKIFYLSFSRNFGKEAAMYAGLEKSLSLDYDATIYMDIDLQDHPKYIIEMLKYYEKGFNIVNTRFKMTKKLSVFKRIPRFLLYKFYSFMTKDKSLLTGLRDYALIDNKTAGLSLFDVKDNIRFTKGLYSYVGFKQKTIDIEYNDKLERKSKWNFKKSFKYAMNGMFELSNIFNFVMNLLLFISVLFFVFDLGLGIYSYINSIKVTYYAFLDLWTQIKTSLLVVLVMTGLDVMCHLMSRVKDETRKRSRYYIKDEKID